jgi:SAM-dependent methyltransferase
MSVAMGNILVMPFKSGVFDTAVCLNTIYNFSSLPEFKPAFMEMLRIIRNNGKIIIDIRNRRNPVLRIKFWLHNRKKLFPTNPYAPEEISREMNTAGCRLVQKKAVGINNRYLAWGYVMVFEKGAES